MRKLFAKHPWLLVVAGLLVFVVMDLVFLIIALINQPVVER